MMSNLATAFEIAMEKARRLAEQAAPPPIAEYSPPADLMSDSMAMQAAGEEAMYYQPPAPYSSDASASMPAPMPEPWQAPAFNPYEPTPDFQQPMQPEAVASPDFYQGDWNPYTQDVALPGPQATPDFTQAEGFGPQLGGGLSSIANFIGGLPLPSGGAGYAASAPSGMTVGEGAGNIATAVADTAEAFKGLPLPSGGYYGAATGAPSGATVGDVYTVVDYPSEAGSQFLRNNLPDPIANPIATGFDVATSPETVAGAFLGGPGVLSNVLGRGTQGAVPYFTSAFGAGLAGQAAADAGAPPVVQGLASVAGGVGGALAPAAIKGLGNAGVDAAQNYARSAMDVGDAAVPTQAASRAVAPPATFEGGGSPIRAISPTEGTDIAPAAGGMPKLSKEELIAQQKALLGDDAATWTIKTGPEIEAEQQLKSGYYRDTGHVTKRANALSEAMDAQKADKPLLDNGYRAGIGPGNNNLEKAALAAVPDWEKFNIEQFAAAEAATKALVAPNEPLRASVVKNAVDALAAPISIKSVLSPPFLRQGMTRFATAPRAAIDELMQSMKAAMSEQQALDLNWRIKTDPLIRSTQGIAGDALAGKTWQDVGGTILTFGSGSTLDTAPEELAALRQSWLGRKIQGFGPAKLSDRQAALELNLHRTNWYKGVAANMIKAGADDPAEYVKLREFIEHATQRGSWSQGSIPAFFSTRALSGRVQAVIDILANIPGGLVGGYARPGVAQETGKTLLGMTAAGSAMIGIPAALGLGNIEMKNGLPTLRVGNDHFDPWAGWNPIAKLAIGIGKDIEERVGEGNYRDLPQDAFSVVGGRTVDFLKRGLSPSFGLGVATASKKDFLGQPFNLADRIASGEVPADLLAPFIIQSIYDAYREGGIESAIRVGVPSFFSVGTNTYVPNAEIANERIAEEMKKGLLPTTYTDENGQQKPVKTYADLRAADPLAADEFNKRNPDIMDKRQSVQSETSQRINELHAEFNTRQQKRDTILLPTDPEEWRKVSAADNAEVQAAIEERARDFGDYEKEPQSLLDLANMKYHTAIEASTVDDQVDWDKVDRELAKMSPQEQDLLFANRLAGETDARKQYIRDLVKLEPFFQSRDEAWARLQQANPEFAQYKDLDAYRLAKVLEVMQKNPGYPRPVVEDLIDKSLGVLTQSASLAGAQYLVQNRELVPLLAKYGFSVPALVAPLAGQPIAAGGAGR